MPPIATVSISGISVGQLSASRKMARNICQKLPDIHSSRNDSSDPQASRISTVRRAPVQSAAKAMDGVNTTRRKSGVASRKAMASSLRPRHLSQTGM
jgi:hypothetical protein